MRSTWSAVPARPTASRRSSVSGVATRVRARTLAYESSPHARARASRGSVPRARATRTRSRAAPRSSPTRQLSQAAQERKPVFQPSRASNSRMRFRRRAVAASRCTDSSAISSPSRSSESVSMASLPSSTWATLYPSFAAIWEDDERRSRHDRHSLTNIPAMTSWGFCGPLGRHSPRAADPRAGPRRKLSSGKWQVTPPSLEHIRPLEAPMSLMLQAQDDLSVVVQDLVHVRGRQARLVEIEEILPIRLEREEDRIVAPRHEMVGAERLPRAEQRRL